MFRFVKESVFQEIKTGKLLHEKECMDMPQQSVSNKLYQRDGGMYSKRIKIKYYVNYVTIVPSVKMPRFLAYISGKSSIGRGFTPRPASIV